MNECVLWIAEKNNCVVVRVANVESEKFPARDLVMTSRDSGYVDIDPKVHEWSNYFKSGMKGALTEMAVMELKNLDCLVDGSVPAV